MAFEMISIFSPLIQKQAIAEIEKCNDLTSRFGLVLSHSQAIELVETRSLSLKNTGRIEFGGGVINKIISEFCDSPYISKYNYVETIHELVEMFYYYKNETLDLMSDDDLIKFMKKSYDGICQGSLITLSDQELAGMARNIRYGYAMDYLENQENEEDEDEDDEY
ncbi:MAG: DUF6323 family protein [Oscillospiraceae bacterium]